MVFIMILITAFFFVTIDFALRFIMQFVFKIGS